MSNLTKQENNEVSDERDTIISICRQAAAIGGGISTYDVLDAVEAFAKSFADNHDDNIMAGLQALAEKAVEHE